MTVKVGEAHERFIVHEPVLREQSCFFRAIIEKKQWKEGMSGEIELPEDDPNIFSVYLEWLYSRKLTLVYDPSTTDATDPLFTELASLYVFGEKVQDDNFCDTIVTQILHATNRLNKFPCSAANHIIYEGTPETSPARRLLVHLTVEHGTPDWIDRDEQDHADFLIDLARELLARRKDLGAEDTSVEVCCRWHKHESQHECSAPAATRSD